MKNMESSDKTLIKTAGQTLSKMTLFICCTIIAGMMISTCQVDEATIIQCEESCGSTAGMKEVTGTTCTCNPNPSFTQDPWVLPRN